MHMVGNKKILCLLVFVLGCSFLSAGQDAATLMNKVRQRMAQVREYHARGRMKTDVAFLKIPVADVQVFYRQPDRFRIKKDGGITLLPKGGVSINLNSFLSMDDFIAIHAGSSVAGGTPVSVVKLIPANDQGDIMLATVYIDEKNLLIRKSVTTTRDNGTFEMECSYGKFTSWGLPDKVVVSFSTKDYKLPKGVTFEYETGDIPDAKDERLKNKKGKIEIQYTSYTINQGVPDGVFR
jgi:hypothetical protein